jgi:hypothetical protein
MEALISSALLHSNEDVFLTSRFPEKVFTKNWCAYYFFDPDILFSPTFFKIALNLVGKDGSGCAVMRNLDSHLKQFIFSHLTTEQDYENILYDQNNVCGWVYNFDRYVCCPNIGNWVIYAERNNDLAVIGIEKDFNFETSDLFLRVKKIEDAFFTVWCAGLDGLSDNWRQSLITNYK